MHSFAIEASGLGYGSALETRYYQQCILVAVAHFVVGVAKMTAGMPLVNHGSFAKENLEFDLADSPYPQTLTVKDVLERVAGVNKGLNLTVLSGSELPC